jgi:hypothetical protein
VTTLCGCRAYRLVPGFDGAAATKFACRYVPTPPRYVATPLQAPPAPTATDGARQAGDRRNPSQAHVPAPPTLKVHAQLGAL